MSREIKFRGKDTNNGEWVYGSIMHAQDGVFIFDTDCTISVEEPEYHYEGMGCGLEDRNITDRYDAMAHGWECAMERVFQELPIYTEVEPDTVGQFTGLKDCNYRDVFDGDKIKLHPSDEGTEVFYSDNDFCYLVWVDSLGDYMSLSYLKGFKNFEVIGTIHDKEYKVDE